MTDPNSLDSVIARLRRLLENGALSAKAQKTFQSLLDRLTSPVRVTIFGPPGVGKSALRSIIAGENLIPDGLKLSTSTLRHADAPKISAILGDGSKLEIAGLDFAALGSRPAAYIDVFAPLPALKKMSLLEVVTDGSRLELQAAAKWAAARTDIAIWATETFHRTEQAVWAKMPDELKDHGFLVQCDLDKVSVVVRENQVVDLNEIAAEEFHNFFTVAPFRGLAALGGNSHEDKEQFQASGCGALLRALNRHLELGLQADIDNALLLLTKYEIVDVNAESKPGKHRSDADTPQPLAVETVLGATGPSPPEADAQDSAVAVADLGSRAQAMLCNLDFCDPSVSKLILDECVDAVEAVADEISADHKVTDTVSQARDAVVLMQLENIETAAEDAVVTLLQLKRELEVAQAA